MQKMTLFNIAAEQLRINDMLEESGGELTPELEEALVINEGNFMVKVEGYVETIARYKALAEIAAQRIAELQRYKKTAENIQKRLKEYLGFGMELMGRDKVEVGLGGDLGSPTRWRPGILAKLHKTERGLLF